MTPIEKLRRETFETISRLAYNRSAEQAESFFDQFNWTDLPMNRNREIQQFFGNPNLPYPDDPLSALFQQESVQARVAAMKEIIALVNGLHYNCAIMAQGNTFGKKPKTRLEAEAYTLEHMKAETVREVVALSGLPRQRIEYLLSQLLTMSGDARRRMMRREFAEAETEKFFPRRPLTANDGQPLTVTFKSREPNPFESIPIPESMFSYLRLPTNKEKIFGLIDSFLAERSRFFVMVAARARRVEALNVQLLQLAGDNG